MTNIGKQINYQNKIIKEDNSIIISYVYVTMLKYLTHHFKSSHDFGLY